VSPAHRNLEKLRELGRNHIHKLSNISVPRCELAPWCGDCSQVGRWGQGTEGLSAYDTPRPRPLLQNGAAREPDVKRALAQMQRAWSRKGSGTHRTFVPAKQCRLQVGADSPFSVLTAHPRLGMIERACRAPKLLSLEL